MSDQVNADLAIMTSVASKLATDYGTLQQAISTLQGEADAHTTSWSGEARNAWNSVMPEVNSAWTKLNGVLDEITSHINTSSGHYSETDASNASSYNSVPVTDITSILNRS